MNNVTDTVVVRWDLSDDPSVGPETVIALPAGVIEDYREFSEDAVTDYLSDEYGYCVADWDWFGPGAKVVYAPTADIAMVASVGHEECVIVFDKSMVVSRRRLVSTQNITL